MNTTNSFNNFKQMTVHFFVQFQSQVVFIVTVKSFKILQDLQAEVNAHSQYLKRVLDRGRAMARSNQWNGQEVQERCEELSAEWEDLEEMCEKRSGELNKAVTREQVKV